MTMNRMSGINDAEGWAEMPKRVKDEFERVFNENPKVVELKKKIALYNSTANYVFAMDTARKLSEIRQHAQKNLINDTERSAEQVTLLSMGLPKKSLDEINVLSIAMYMMCDMMEFFAMDINSILKKKDPTARFEMFNPVIEIGRQVKDNLRYLNSHTKMFEDDVFNDLSDDMREMLINKAKKVYNNYARRVKKEQSKTE